MERHLKATRQEADANVGYFFHPRFAVAVGYKGIFQNLTGTDTFIAGGLTGTRKSFDANFNYNGVTGAVLLNAPLAPQLVLFGNLVGGYLWVQCPRPCSSVVEHAEYGNAEFGLAYKLPSFFSATVSYRAQIMNTEFSSSKPSGPGTDVTHGLVFGLNVQF